MANPANIARVAAAIRGEAAIREDLGFNMGAYIGCTVEGVMSDVLGRDCGTVACIAGHAYLLASEASVEEGMNTDSDEIDLAAADYLGIDMARAAALFYDLPHWVNLADVTAEQAIATLERLARTGKVEWRIPEPVETAA